MSGNPLILALRAGRVGCGLILLLGPLVLLVIFLWDDLGLKGCPPYDFPVPPGSTQTGDQITLDGGLACTVTWKDQSSAADVERYIGDGGQGWTSRGGNGSDGLQMASDGGRRAVVTFTEGGHQAVFRR